MALISNAKGRGEEETPSGYERLFGNRQLGMLMSKVQSAVISTGNELEGMLASQSTIHPKDNCVFSIRELMIMMSVPDSFKWSSISEKELNKMGEEEKRKFLSKNEMNIRQ